MVVVAGQQGMLTHPDFTLELPGVRVRATLNFALFGHPIAIGLLLFGASSDSNLLF